MLFDAWLIANEVTNAEAAAKLGTSLGHVSDLRHRRYWPGRSMAIKIVDYTDGVVAPNDFLPDVTQRKIDRLSSGG